MPAISLFYGITICMYYDDANRHHLPYIHAGYQGQSAVIAIDDCRVLDGSLPPSKLRIVQAWVEVRREDLLADWQLAMSRKTLFNIEPLR